MFIAFLVLTILSAIILIIGSVWTLSAWGKTTRRSGPDVGAEIMSGAATDDPDVGITLAHRSAFAGKGVAVGREASVPYAEVKRLLRAGDRKAALPPLLGMVGLFCFIVFGALALWVALDDKLIATLVAIPVLYTMARIARDVIRA